MGLPNMTERLRLPGPGPADADRSAAVLENTGLDKEDSGQQRPRDTAVHRGFRL